MTSLNDIIKVRLESLQEAAEELIADDTAMSKLRDEHPESYRESVHATSLATHIQGIFTGIESTLIEILKKIDGKVPTGESSHRDVLIEASTANMKRPPILSEGTHKTITELLGFRHVVRKNYGMHLKPSRVFENRACALTAVAELHTDIDAFFAALQSHAETPINAPTHGDGPSDEAADGAPKP